MRHGPPASHLGLSLIRSRAVVRVGIPPTMRSSVRGCRFTVFSPNPRGGFTDIPVTRRHGSAGGRALRADRRASMISGMGMSSTIQAIIFNASEEAAADLREHIYALNFVRVNGEVSDASGLAELLANSSPNLAFFFLGPDPAEVIALIDEVSARYPGLAMIAIGRNTNPESILAPIRAGCDQFVCWPIDPNDLATAVSRVASKRLLTRSTSQCICITAASGGVGVTSLASNLALEIGQLTAKPCALVDLDFQFGDLALLFDCDPKYTFYHLADSGAHFDRTVLESVVSKFPGTNVVLLPRPEKIEQTEGITADVVHRAIELLTSTYEFAVVDVPRRLDACTNAALGQADKILIVCQLIVPSLRNAARYHDALMRLGIPEDRLEVIVNRSDATGGRVTTKDIEEAIKKPVFGVVPNDYHYVARSLDFGRPFSTAERNSSVRTAIAKIARSLVGDAAKADASAENRRGFLSRLLSK